jgi:hypothetical protein
VPPTMPSFTMRYTPKQKAANQAAFDDRMCFD